VISVPLKNPPLPTNDDWTRSSLAARVEGMVLEGEAVGIRAVVLSPIVRVIVIVVVGSMGVAVSGGTGPYPNCPEDGAEVGL
jgi:hypothetical protein